MARGHPGSSSPEGFPGASQGPGAASLGRTHETELWHIPNLRGSWEADGGHLGSSHAPLWETDLTSRPHFWPPYLTRLHSSPSSGHPFPHSGCCSLGPLSFTLCPPRHIQLESMTPKGPFLGLLARLLSQEGSAMSLCPRPPYC